VDEAVVGYAARFEALLFTLFQHGKKNRSIDFERNVKIEVVLSLEVVSRRAI
jgi:hypothetical protein